MAAKKTSQTALSVAIVVVVLFLAYKFLPGLLRALRGGGSSSYANTPSYGGGSGFSPFSPQRPSSGGGGSPSLNFGGGGGGRGGFSGVFPQGFYDAVQQGWNDIYSGVNDLSTDPNQVTSVAGVDSPGLDSVQLPYDPLQLLDLQGTSIDGGNSLFSSADYSALVGDTGPNANGSYDVGGGSGGIDTSYNNSLDSFQFDPAVYDQSGGGGGGDYGGGGGGDYTGYDNSGFGGGGDTGGDSGY